MFSLIVLSNHKFLVLEYVHYVASSAALSAK